MSFDCGGQQWVFEVCFKSDVKVGESFMDEKKRKEIPKDIQFIKDLLELIEEYDIPAPCPIEHRWTSASSSRSVLSPPPFVSFHSLTNALSDVTPFVSIGKRVHFSLSLSLSFRVHS